MNRILSQEEKDKKLKRLKKKYAKKLRDLGKEGVLVALNGMPNHTNMLVTLFLLYNVLQQNLLKWTSK